ncbi:MAG: host-nuclease inhibitor Gam family protein [Ignavibacteria bacterium]|nr:host-nuclease inhibitor Gam family protein [Ignavibacteria bacterium]
MAKTKPQTDQRTTLKSWEEVDTALKAIAVIRNKVSQEENVLNEKILKAQEASMPIIERMKSEEIGLERDVQLYCEQNKTLFDESRSRELNYGIVGFRKGTGALKTLKGFTWEAVKSVIKSSKKFKDEFMRVKEEIDKNAILSSGLKPDQLAKLGVHIFQEDNFFIDVFSKEARKLEDVA